MTTSSYDNQDLIGPAKKGQCEVYNLMVRVVFGGIVAVLGLCGNILTIIILSKDREKSTTIQCLIYLAIVDSLVLLQFGFATVSVSALQWFSGNLLARGYQLTIIARLIPSAQATNHISAGITVMVTWQRYISVCRPHQVKRFGSPRLVKVLMTCLIIFAWCFNMPSFFAFNVAYDKSFPGSTKLVPRSMVQHWLY